VLLTFLYIGPMGSTVPYPMFRKREILRVPNILLRECYQNDVEIIHWKLLKQLIKKNAIDTNEQPPHNFGTQKFGWFLWFFFLDFPNI
jgi:hypothetical protein